MTVSTIGSTAEFDTNGVTTNYPFYFKFLANEDLVVTYVDPLGVSSTLTLGTHYTVNGAGNDQGGSIVTTSALAGPGQLVVAREMDAFQQTSLRNQGKFLAEIHEDVFDRLTMLIQQGFSIFSRALKRPFGRDYFFAENRRIANIHDPIESQDAVTKLYNERYIAGLLSDFTGPLNNAANVMYIYPDGVARSVQSLATKNDPSLGSAGVAHNNGTVRDALLALGTGIDANGKAIQQANVERYASLNDVNSWLSLAGYIKGRKINWLGDSISFGAGAGTAFGSRIPENSYVRIIGNALNEKYGVYSYGFVSPYDSNGTGVEIHSVSLTGTWTEMFDAAAGHTPAGYCRRSTQSNSTISFNQSVETSHFKIWYDGSVTGSFEISVNGGAVIVDTITTTGTGNGLECSATYSCSPLAAGNTNYRVRVISGEVRVTGISYLNDATGLEYQLNNFSRDGRGGRFVTENTIKEMCRGCLALVWALAANDRATTGADLAAYQQRIDWLITYCNQYGTRLIIPDFLFINDDNNPIRQELRRLASAVPNSTYIPFPNMLHVSGLVQPASYVTGTINFTYDDVHLSQSIGHRIVAAAIGEALGVKASKLDNLTNNARWKPLPLSGGANPVLTYAGISKYRFYGKALELYLSINPVTSGTVVATIPSPPGTFLDGQYRSSPDTAGKTAIVLVSSTGQITVFTDSASSGAPSVVVLNVRIPMVSIAGFA